MPRPRKETKAETGYRFKDKDPCIDAFRYALKESKLNFGQLAQQCRVSEGTLRNWDYGETRKPQHATLRSAMEALGFHEQWVNGEQVLVVNYVRGSGPSFRIRKA